MDAKRRDDTMNHLIADVRALYREKNKIVIQVPAQVEASLTECFEKAKAWDELRAHAAAVSTSAWGAQTSDWIAAFTNILKLMDKLVPPESTTALGELRRRLMVGRADGHALLSYEEVFKQTDRLERE